MCGTVAVLPARWKEVELSSQEKKLKLDTMLVGVVALLLSQKLLAAGQPDTIHVKKFSHPIFNPSEANLAPSHESSQLVRYVRNADDDSIDYEEYGEQTEQDQSKPGRKKKGQKKKFVERQEDRTSRNGRGGEIEKSLLFCFKVCNSLIFEVYQLLGGNVCNCEEQ